MNLKAVLSLVTSLVLVFTVNAQRQKVVFAEALGNTHYGSLNFDQRFNSSTHFGLGYKIGVGYYPSTSGVKRGHIGIPIGVNYLLGKGHHALELGLVPTPEFRFGKKQIPNDTANLKLNAPMIFNLNFNAGYRFVPIKDKGLMFNILWTPIIVNNYSYPVSVNPTQAKLFRFSLGLGYYF